MDDGQAILSGEETTEVEMKKIFIPALGIMLLLAMASQATAKADGTVSVYLGNLPQYGSLVVSAPSFTVPSGMMVAPGFSADPELYQGWTGSNLILGEAPTRYPAVVSGSGNYVFWVYDQDTGHRSFVGYLAFLRPMSGNIWLGATKQQTGTYLWVPAVEFGPVPVAPHHRNGNLDPEPPVLPTPCPGAICNLGTVSLEKAGK